MQRDAVPLVPGLVTPPQHGGVVAAHLGAARPVGGGAVEVVQDERLDGVRAVVDARGQDVDAKDVLLRRVQAELGRRAVDLRADVHGGAGGVRGHVFGIEGDCGFDGIDEEVGRDGRDRDELGAVLQAHGVAVRAKDRDGRVARQAESLEALVGLLTVVEGRRHAVDAHVGVGNETEWRPFPRLDRVVRLDVAVDWRAERWLV